MKDNIWYDVIHMNIAYILFGRLWHFDRKVKNDKEMNTYTLLWNAKRIRLIPMNSTAPSLYTSSPSTNEPQKEQNVELMFAPKAKTEDIKDNIEEQVHSKGDFVGTKNIHQGSTTQEWQRVEEKQGQTNI